MEETSVVEVKNSIWKVVVFICCAKIKSHSERNNIILLRDVAIAFAFEFRKFAKKNFLRRILAYMHRVKFAQSHVEHANRM